jgi:anti-sigma regulatory factor (Ser/Thr protein kinase)
MLGVVRRWVGNTTMAAGLDQGAAAEMGVAVGEVLSNVHRHAYQDGMGPVLVHVFRVQSVVAVVVVDRGHAAGVPNVPDTPPEYLEHTGRGLYLARRLTDRLEIRRNPRGQGLSVRLVKRLRPADTDAARRLQSG